VKAIHYYKNFKENREGNYLAKIVNAIGLLYVLRAMRFMHIHAITLLLLENTFQELESM
jgi:hypothetical protein